MQHLINRPIGAGLENDPDDIRLVRGTLKALNGEKIIPENLSGFIDDDLDADIRNFQQKSGLTEDGRLAPEGETERNLISRITGQGIDVAAPRDATLRRSVGDGGENDPADVAAVKRALGTLGYLKYDRTAPPSPFIDTKTVAALTEFQNDTKLLPDGRADPEGPTIESLRELLGENPDGPASDETQVALGPALIPLFLLLARAAPHAVKLARGAPAIGAVVDAGNKTAENNRKRGGERDEESNFTGDRSEGTKLEHIPPDPNRFGGGRTEFPSKGPDGSENKQEGRPTDPVTDIPAGFPMPKNPENLVEIFPGNTDMPELPLIIERKGNETTRSFNAKLVRGLEAIAKKNGLQVEHIGGSRDADGREVPETHLKNRDTGGLKGGSFADITLLASGKRKFRILINTTDTRADGTTLSTRENEAAVTMLYNMEDNALLFTIAKARANETIDFDVLEDMLDPVVKLWKNVADGELDRDVVKQWIKFHEKLPTK